MVSDETYEKLKEVTDIEERSISDYVRDAIEHKLSANERREEQ